MCLLLFAFVCCSCVRSFCFCCYFYLLYFLNVYNETTLKWEGEGGNVLFNDILNTFYLWLYGVGYMVKDHSDSERRNPLSPHGLLFLISSKGSFMCTIPQTG